jgi:hypothetical protein
MKAELREIGVLWAKLEDWARNHDCDVEMIDRAGQLHWTCHSNGFHISFRKGDTFQPVIYSGDNGRLDNICHVEDFKKDFQQHVIALKKRVPLLLVQFQGLVS